MHRFSWRLPAATRKDFLFFGLALLLVQVYSWLLHHADYWFPFAAKTEKSKMVYPTAQNNKFEVSLPEYQFFLNQRLVDHVRANNLIRPSTMDYNLSRPDVQDPCPSHRISEEVYPQFLKGVKNGVFVEVGTLMDGETSSTTLFLERELGWRGLLVGMTPRNHQLVLNKHRKAFFAPVCLSPLPWPIQSMAKKKSDPDEIGTQSKADKVSHIRKRNKLEKRKSLTDNKGETHLTTVHCYPLHTMLAAAGFTKVDFMSLDLVGVELLEVLKTLGWDLLDIKVLYMQDSLNEDGTFAAIRSFLVSKGYKCIERGKEEPVIFAKNS